MRLPFVSRRRYDDDLAEITGLRRRIVATEERHDEAEEERRQAVDELAAVTIVNGRLTEDLAKERQVSESLARQIHAMAQPVDPDPDAIDWPAKYEAEQERADLLQAELDDARLLAARLTAVVETRQAFDDQGRPVDAAPPVRRDAGSARLRRERAIVRKLEQRLSEMQLSHVADTRELHDLRQKGAAS
jgi:hypothetical protein